MKRMSGKQFFTWLKETMDRCFDLSKECAHAEHKAFPKENKAAEIIGDAASKVYSVGHNIYTKLIDGKTVDGKEIDSAFKEIDETITARLVAAGVKENNAFVLKFKAAVAK